MKKLSLRSAGLGLAAPVGALIFALLLCALILVITGHSPVEVVDQMVKSVQRPRTVANSLNSATTFTSRPSRWRSASRCGCSTSASTASTGSPR